jgi:hypothetical protein
MTYIVPPDRCCSSWLSGVLTVTISPTGDWNGPWGNPQLRLPWRLRQPVVIRFLPKTKGAPLLVFSRGIHSSSPGLMEHPDFSRLEDGGSHGHLPDLRVCATHPSPEKWRRMGHPDSFGSARVGNPPRNHSPMKFWKGKNWSGNNSLPCPRSNAYLLGTQLARSIREGAESGDVRRRDLAEDDRSRVSLVVWPCR